MGKSQAYHPDLAILALGDSFFDPVEAATFPDHKVRFFNRRWAERVGLGNVVELIVSPDGRVRDCRRGHCLSSLATRVRLLDKQTVTTQHRSESIRQ